MVEDYAIEAKYSPYIFIIYKDLLNEAKDKAFKIPLIPPKL